MESEGEQSTVIIVNEIQGTSNDMHRFLTKAIADGYLSGLNNIPDTTKNKGIWKDHIQLLAHKGIDVCPQTIKNIAIPLAISIHAILCISLFI
ncbi:MAG: hypothetical protein SPE09_04185 [Alloprevotella sp.]|nr:hypothetical protein [Alloprevotella sp.]